ncbi:RHS repeat-associated core domain-containing protein [Flavobacterium sp.]|uniref:RHS repeat-associated core domain-containing protein n=1 Tax=Flavobacterium sp. TaxID=239 RepID=UPI003D6ACE45
MISDANKQITSIVYNHLNLPTKIVFNNDNNLRIEYLYTADGTKLQKTVTQSGAALTTLYFDGFQYVDNVLQFFPHAEGYVNNTVVNGTNVYNYVYNYTDHLGNVRLSYGVDPATGVLKTLEENNYYPFGLKHKNYNMSQKAYIKAGSGTGLEPCIACPRGYQYKYNGKELQDELGLNMYDYGARNYDPALGRWMNMDAKAEKYLTLSPYTYAINNPMFFVDPDGNEIDIYYGKDNREKAKYTYQKDRDYSKVKGGAGGFLADAYEALDRLYEASNIEVDGKTVNVVQSLINDSRELSVVQRKDSENDLEGSIFNFGRSYPNSKNNSTKSISDIGTIHFNNVKGVLFDDTKNSFESNLMDQYYGNGKLAKTAKVNSPTSVLGHELIHAFDYMSSSTSYFARRDSNSVFLGTVKYPNQEEARATTLSSQINIKLNENPRNNYRALMVPTESVTSNKIIK